MGGRYSRIEGEGNVPGPAIDWGMPIALNPALKTNLRAGRSGFDEFRDLLVRGA